MKTRFCNSLCSIWKKGDLKKIMSKNFHPNKWDEKTKKEQPFCQTIWCWTDSENDGKVNQTRQRIKTLQVFLLDCSIIYVKIPLKDMETEIRSLKVCFLVSFLISWIWAVQRHWFEPIWSSRFSRWCKSNQPNWYNRLNGEKEQVCNSHLLLFINLV